MPKFTFDFRTFSTAAAGANNAAAAGISGLVNRNGTGLLAVVASGSGYNVGRFTNSPQWFGNYVEVTDSGGVDGTDQYVRAIIPPKASTGDYKSFGLIAKGFWQDYSCGIAAYWQNSAGAGTVPNTNIDVFLASTGRTTLLQSSPSFAGGWNPTRWHAIELHAWLDGSVIKTQIKSWQAGAGFTSPANGSAWVDWIAGMGTAITQNGTDYTPDAGQLAAGINTGIVKLNSSIEYHYSTPSLASWDLAFLEVEESTGFIPLTAKITASAGVLTAVPDSGVGTKTFQWHGKKDSLVYTPDGTTLIAGAINNTYTPNPPQGEIWGYTCVVTDSNTPTAQTATTTAYPAERAWPSYPGLPPVASQFATKIGIFFVGDSISEPGDYQFKVKALLEANGVTTADVINYQDLAASGSASDDWLGDTPYNDGSGPRVLKTSALAAIDSYRSSNPGVPVIGVQFLETNNIQRAVSFVTTRAWIDYLKSQCDSRSIPLVICAPPFDHIDVNHGHRTLTYRGNTRDYVSSLGLVWAAARNTMLSWKHRKSASNQWNWFDNSEYIAPDWYIGNADVHPTTEWHTEFANQIYKDLRLNVIGNKTTQLIAPSSLELESRSSRAISVMAKNASNTPIVGATITATSSDLDVTITPSVVTGAGGVAVFDITADADNIVGDTATITFVSSNTTLDMAIAIVDKYGSGTGETKVPKLNSTSVILLLTSDMTPLTTVVGKKVSIQVISGEVYVYSSATTPSRASACYTLDKTMGINTIDIESLGWVCAAGRGQIMFTIEN